MQYVQPYGIPPEVHEGDAPYINGNPSIGLAGSIPPASAFEHPMRELVHMIGLSGFTPTSLDLYQLLKAVRSQAVNYVLDKGVTNSLVVAFNPALDGYTNGLIVRVKVAHPNTGPSQIDCGPGFRPIVRIDGSPLAPSDMVAGGVAVLVYVDTEFQLVNPNIAAAIESAIEGISGGGGGPVTGGGGTTYVTNVYNGFQGMASWMVAGSFNWTVPVGVRKLWVKLWAGGGPGIEWTPHDVQGLFIKGGDGGYCEDLYDVVPGTVMQINVGAGAPPPVPITTGNVFHDAATWKATYGQPSSFGAAGQPVICSCTGGRGCYPNPPGDVDPSPGEPGIGTGARIVRSNGLYGRGGGSYQTSDGVHDDYAEISGDPGACILLY